MGNIRLIVDDEPGVRNFAETILKKYGYNIKTAIDGEEALEIYEKQKDNQANAKTLYTAKNGTITITIDKKGEIEVKTFIK